jgi:hypothetical protein
MGKDEANEAAGQAAQAQTRLAEQLVGQTDPLRRGLISDANQFLRGGRDVTGLPEFAAAKGASEAQFGVARDNIIANTPEGGALISALSNLESDRAANQVAFTGDIASNEVNRALQLGTFGAAQGSQGLSNAGFIQAQRATAESQANAGKAQGLGEAAGASAAAAITKSDRRLKRNIKHIGMYGPYNMYSFTIDGIKSMGVMAQEMPDKFVTEMDGYLAVDYGML